MPVDVPSWAHPLLVAGALAAAFTALGAVTHKVVRTMIPVWRRIRAMHEIIERELAPNGGSSIRDRVHRTADETERIGRRVAAMAGDMQEIAAAKDREHAELWSALGDLGYDRRHTS